MSTETTDSLYPCDICEKPVKGEGPICQPCLDRSAAKLREANKQTEATLAPEGFSIGPWKIERVTAKEAGEEPGEDALWIMAGDDEPYTNWPLAVVNHAHDSFDDSVKKEHEANARLIAQSPTMYEYISQKAAEGEAEAQNILSLINA